MNMKMTITIDGATVSYTGDPVTDGMRLFQAAFIAAGFLNQTFAHVVLDWVEEHELNKEPCDGQHQAG